MLKIYEVNGMTFQFEEGEQPKGAVEVKAGKPKTEKKPKGEKKDK